MIAMVEYSEKAAVCGDLGGLEFDEAGVFKADNMVLSTNFVSTE